MFIELFVAWASESASVEVERAALHEACAVARRDRKPVLLEFSAPWCGDCRRLAELAGESPLAEELGEWHLVKVDVGRFDRHEDLRTLFGVGAIAWWTALRPGRASCTQVDRWEVLANSSFEPASGQTGPRSAAEIAQWLIRARAARAAGAR
jgi:thiol-disulfide isomerase/thioredoxin